VECPPLPTGLRRDRRAQQRHHAGREVHERWFPPAGLEPPGRIEDAGDRGRVDRVDLLPDGRCELIDYKVGRTWDEKRVREDLQLSVYQMGAAEVWGIEPARLTYYFVLEDKPVSLRKCGEELSAAREIIRDVAENILAERFDPVEGYLSCRYCDYTLVCPAKDKG